MSKRFDHYDGWAWLYDKTMGPEYGKDQLAMLRRVLLPRLPQKAEILDLCCGTGQMVRWLLDEGYQVTGLDSSEEMLTCAKRNAPSGIYVLEDARKYRAVDKFHAVFSTSASLNHVPTIEDLSQIFANVRDSLHRRGTFVFDLNHHSQLAKWWRGRPTEGAIAEDYAWMVTPRYDAKQGQGAFRVTMYRAPKQMSFIQKCLVSSKQPINRLLGRPRFVGLRLKLIEQFKTWEPRWEKDEIDFPIVGHDLDAVSRALDHVGFADIRVETIDGSPTMDDDHSAHFICSKAA